MMSYTQLFVIVFKAAFSMGLQVMYTINTDNCGETSQGQVPTNMIDLRTYGLDNTQKTAFLFDVKAKQDIAVLATDTYDIHNSENYYRLYIGLGGNMWCHIGDVRNGYFTERQNIYASYADELNSKPFWFSWVNGEIKAGHGDMIGQQTFLPWSDPSPMYIYGIGIGTCWGHTGEWKIKIDVADNSIGHFSKCQRSNTRSDLPIIASYLSSKLSCAENCATEKTCIGFNYQLTINRCELLSSGEEPLTSIMRQELEGWTFYTKCYNGKTVCVGCFF